MRYLGNKKYKRLFLENWIYISTMLLITRLLYAKFFTPICIFLSVLHDRGVSTDLEKELKDTDFRI